MPAHSSIASTTLCRRMSAASVLLGQALLMEPALAKITVVDDLQPSQAVVIDVGEATRCHEWTLNNAFCLPLSDLLASHQRLPNFSGLLWLWGCLGLSGEETVIVIGDRAVDQYLVAGLLHLSGQSHVSVLKRPSKTWQQANLQLTAGRTRPNTRRVIYTASMRTSNLLLVNELSAKLHTENVQPIFDGRSEAEYWGETILTHRGGHIPGAISSPMPQWWKDVSGNFQQSQLLPTEPIVYAHDAVDSIVYYALLTSRSFAPTVLLGGWAAWATNSTLAVDAESFVTHRPLRQQNAPAVPNSASSSISRVLGVMAVVLFLFTLGFYFWRFCRQRKV